MNMTTGKLRLRVMCLACLLTGCGGGLDPSDTGRDSFHFPDDADPTLAALPFVESELLVQPYPGADARALSDLYAQAGAIVLDEVEEIQLTVLEVSTGRLNGVAVQLDASGLVETLAKNYIFEFARVPNDPLFARQPHLEQINAPAAWNETVGDEEIIIAVIDSGVDAEHPDLSAKLLSGWNIRDDNSDTRDVLGHGTFVAGVATAVSNNAVGVTGVSWESVILPVRVTDDEGRATARDLAAAILWALNHDAKVINVSFAPLCSNGIVRAAAEYAFNRGAIVVISAGNSSGTMTCSGYSQALFVGAVDASDEIAFFSDRGPFVDLVAPGTAIRSTWIGSEYRMETGTSFAAPIVSGVVALAWAVDPDLSPMCVQTVVLDTATNLGSMGKDTTFGDGLVDAHAAVLQAANTACTPDTTPPTVSVDRPADGAVLSGRFVATATVTDLPQEGSAADVMLSIDGVPFATDVRAPYRFVIDTAAFSEGDYELAFDATDLAGHVSPSESVTVTFSASSSSSTTITFQSPTDGAAVSGTVAIVATVSDADGLAMVEWYIDGDSVLAGTASGRSSHVSYVWRTTNWSVGHHTITIVVTDATGRKTRGNLDLVIQ